MEIGLIHHEVNIPKLETKFILDFLENIDAILISNKLICGTLFSVFVCVKGGRGGGFICIE